MGWKTQLRAMEAQVRREEREAKKRQRELERQAKEFSKLSQQQQASFEVEEYENKLEMLQSVHKEQGEVCDWLSIFSTLPPLPPKKRSFNELRALQNIAITPPHLKSKAPDSIVEQARSHDEQEFQDSIKSYSDEKAELDRFKSLSRRMLDRDRKAYKDALTEFNPFAEIHRMGSKVRFVFNSSKIISVIVKFKGTEVIPSEVKSLTSTGKLSVKQMPKSRFQELYQDCICSCMLRIARESFAILPIDTILITATIDALDSSTGQTIEQSVLSVVIPRSAMSQLDFDRLDPSDAIETFLHRGNFKASRKAGAFGPITPLTSEDMPSENNTSTHIADSIPQLNKMREKLRQEIEELRAEYPYLSEEKLA